MVSSAPLPAGAPQWADQIERLCGLLETITYRLLEVEERLASLEERLEEGLAAGASGQEEALTAQLEETARRVARMEAALGGMERGRAGEGFRPEGAGGRRLQALAPPLPWPDPDGQPEEAESEPDPFYDEEEQAFMDERTA